MKQLLICLIVILLFQKAHSKNSLENANTSRMIFSINAGSLVFKTSGKGVSGEFQFQENLVTGVGIYTMNGATDLFSDGTYHNNIKGNLVDIFLKYYPGTSFYSAPSFAIIGGLVYNSITETGSGLLNNDISYSITGSELAFKVGIGNYFIWDRLTFGCQWIGYIFSPISNSYETNIQINRTVSNDEVDNYNSIASDKKTSLIKGGQIQLLNFSLGYIF
jgi:hypothetical protein